MGAESDSAGLGTNGESSMTDTTCNGWRNAATWTVNLWFGDHWAELAEDGFDFSPEYLRDMVDEYVSERIGEDNGFIWDMLDLCSVDWDALRDLYAPETPHGEELCRNGRPMSQCECC
jgi:hypothetical protein